MKLGSYQRLSVEQLGGSDVPDWVATLLDILNKQLEPISVALSGKLAFGDNFFAYQTSQKLTHGTEFVVAKPNNAARFIGMLPLYTASNVLINSWAFEIRSDGSAGVTIYYANQSDNSAVAAGTQVQTTLLFLYG